MAPPRRLLTAANDNNEFRFYVYAWLRTDGTPFYVGKGRGGRDMEEGASRNKFFTNIVAKIRKNGQEPRVVRWQHGLLEGDAHRLETAYIKLFGRRDLGTGVLCNLTDGGEGAVGALHSDETRAKRSIALRGKKRSAETRSKMSESKRGENHPFFGETRSAETRAKMSAAARKKYEDQEERDKRSVALRGRTYSETTLAKMSEARRLFGPVSGDFKGVYAAKGKWRSVIRLDGKQQSLGYFLTPEDAARAYDSAAYEAFGDRCYLNFPAN